MENALYATRNVCCQSDMGLSLRSVRVLRTDCTEWPLKVGRWRNSRLWFDDIPDDVICLNGQRWVLVGEGLATHRHVTRPVIGPAFVTPSVIGCSRTRRRMSIVNDVSLYCVWINTKVISVFIRGLIFNFPQIFHIFALIGAVYKKYALIVNKVRLSDMLPELLMSDFITFRWLVKWGGVFRLIWLDCQCCNSKNACRHSWKRRRGQF